MAFLTRSYYHASRRSKPFHGRSLGQQFYFITQQHPDKEMYVFYADKERKTFKQMEDESQNLAASFLSLGLTPGDRVGIWGNNHYEWLLAYLACMQLGLVMVSVRYDFPIPTQKEVLQKIGCKALILARTPENAYEKICELVPELQSCTPDKLLCQSLPDLKFVVIAGKQHKGKRGIYHLDSLLLQGSTSDDKQKVPLICHQIDPDSPAVIYFTSGSTGLPKAVTHSSHSLANNFDADLMIRGDVPGDYQTWEIKYAQISSLSSISGQLGALYPVVRGITSVFVAPSHDKEMLAKALHDERCTNSSVLIHHISDVLNLSNLDSFDFSAHQICIAGGSMIPKTLREEARKFVKTFYMLYASTEMLLSFLQHPTDSEERLESAAFRAVGGLEVKIVDEQGQIVPINTTGEVHVRGYTLFLYYWGDEEKTKQAKDANGWWHSGDMGIMDEEGFIRLVGRKSDFLIVEAINVSPYDLETVLHEHPNVANAVVIGIPDGRTGDAVCACIRLKADKHLSEEEVKHFCESKVSRYLMPKHVLFMEDFPVTPTGKFHRKKIAEIAAETFKPETK